MARKHGAAQARRRASRARARARAEQVLGAPVANQEQARELETLIAAASGSTDLPLSDRGDAWDAGEAAKSLTDAQIPNAYFWTDPKGDPKVKASHKLGFAENRDGTLTAVWRGVTAAAAALQGARGGVDIPEADVAGVKAKIGAYYDKAAKQFKDDSIKPPWESDEAASVAEQFAELADAAGDHSGVTDAADAELAEATEEYTADREDAEQAFQEAATNLARFYITDSTTTASWPLGSFTTTTGANATFTMTFDNKPSVEDVLPDAHKPKSKIPKRNGSPRNLKAPDQPIPTAGQQLQWTATLCPEGALTDDGRAFAPDSISWRELPLTLMGLIETSAEGGHDGAQVAGRIDNIWRENGLIKGSGTFDDGEFGSMIAKMVGDGTLRGISVDLAIHKYDFGPKSDWFNADGEWAPKEQTDDEAPNLLDLLFGESDEDMIFLVTDATIGMATACPFQAFADATIQPAASLVASLQHDAIWTVTQQAAFTVVARPCGCGEADVETLTAAATDAPAGPPSAWFANPELAEPTPLTVDDEGRIYGHAATWNSCHIAFTDQCVQAPHSKTDYAQYLLGEVVSAEGDHISVGTITMNTGHANQSLQLSQAAAHYDHTGTGVADVTVGEDEHGIWFAGAVRPGLSEEAVRVLRAAKLSGDWRNMNGNLELVALLAVNVPGFPVPRPRASIVASGEEQQVAALTAAGIVDKNAQAFAALAEAV